MSLNLKLPSWVAVQTALEEIVVNVLGHASDASAKAPNAALAEILGEAEQFLASQLGSMAGTALHDALSQVVKDSIAAGFAGPNSFDPTSTG